MIVLWFVLRTAFHVESRPYIGWTVVAIATGVATYYLLSHLLAAS